MKYIKDFLFYCSFIFEVLLIEKLTVCFIFPVQDKSISEIDFLIINILLLLNILFIFFQVKYLKKHKLTKVKVVLLPAIIVSMLVLVVCPSISERNNYNEWIFSGKETIRSYLVNNFGEENSKKMHITFKKYDDGSRIFSYVKPTIIYKVSTPILEEPFEVVLNGEADQVLENNFSEKIIEEKALSEAYNHKILAALIGLPKNIEISGHVVSVDIINFNNEYYSVDELLNKSKYKFTGFYIKMDRYSEKEAVRLVRDLFIRYDKVLNVYYLENRVPFYIAVKDDIGDYRNFVSGSAIKINNVQMQLDFGAYTYENGKTIEEFKKIVSID